MNSLEKLIMNSKWAIVRLASAPNERRALTLALRRVRDMLNGMDLDNVQVESEDGLEDA